MPDPQIDSPDASSPRTDLMKRWSELPGNVRGGILFLLGSAIFSVMMALIKLAGQRLHVTEILFIRQVTMVAIAAPMIAAGWPDSLRSARPWLQISRVGFAFLAMILGFSALIHLGLAEVTIISFSKAFFTTLLAIILLGEIVRVPRWVALGLGFLGVLFVMWPEEGQAISIWHVAALASAFCVSAVTVIIRILAQVDRPVTILTYQAVGVGLLMVPPAIYFWQWPTLMEWILLIAIGALSVAAQYLNILAMKAGEASAIAPLEYTRLVFTTLLGLWLFMEWPEMRDWIGAIIIVGAALYVLHRERQTKSD